MNTATKEREAIPVQKLTTLEVDRMVEKARFKTQQAYAAARFFAATLGDCPLSIFKAALTGFMKSEEYLAMDIQAKGELKRLMDWK